MEPTDLKAPYPYPGGKSRVARTVWGRLGDVGNYVEPFMGSLAVLLRRPAEHFRGGYRVETCNDVNHYVVNFWRAVRADPEAVAEYADNPVTEADLHARHKWLVRSAEAAEWRKRMAADPECYDAKVAGWWVWGACCWIGGQWCQDGVAHKLQMPQIDRPRGVHRGLGESPTDWTQTPDLTSSTSGGCGGHRTPPPAPPPRGEGPRRGAGVAHTGAPPRGAPPPPPRGPDRLGSGAADGGEVRPDGRPRRG